MTFFDLWKTFNSRFDESNLTAQAQLVGYKLLAISNEQMLPDSFAVSDRELMSRTNIRSGQTIVEARRQLKNAGLIDFKTSKNKPTTYKFVNPGTSTEQARGKHEPSANQATGSISYTRVREDVKDEKTEYNANAGADFKEVDELMEAWEAAGGAKLNQLLCSKLAALLTHHAPATIKVALEQAATGANNPRYGFSFDYFLRKLEQLEKTTKEGRTNERCEKLDGNRNREYEKPDESDEALWRKYLK